MIEVSKPLQPIVLVGENKKYVLIDECPPRYKSDSDSFFEEWPE